MDLSVENIRVQLQHQSIVKDVSLAVKKGEFVGIIGPNGSGKSTLLKTIYRLIKPVEGTILLSGKNLSALPLSESAKSVGVVSQFNALNFDFTVFDMVMAGRTPHKRALSTNDRQDYELVCSALRQVGMEQYGDRNFSSLSGGEQQRIILARALAQQPKLLILDEPTNHLDIKYQLQLLALVKSLGIGVLSALHDLSLAAMYCDHLYVMKEGHIVASGPPRKILTAALIRDVYEIDCEIQENAATGMLTVCYYPTQLMPVVKGA